MSVIRPLPPADPIAVEAAGRSSAAAVGFGGADVDSLQRARSAVLAAPAGLDIAQRVLADYDANRPASGLFAILQAARRIRDGVDRLVVVAGGSIGPATRLLADACCHPCHDQLPRGERGGRPRLSWLDGRAGSDELLGLLDVIAPPGRDPEPDRDLLDRWAVFAADCPPDDVGIMAVVRVLLAARCAGFACVTAPGSRLARVVGSIDCQEWFRDVPQLGAPLGVFTAAGLVPAAVAGIDVVQLLKGAAAMAVRFTEAAVEVNPVLIDAAVAAGCGRPERLFLGDERLTRGLDAWHRRSYPGPVGGGASITRIHVNQPRRAGLVLPPLPPNAAPDGLGASEGSRWSELSAAGVLPARDQECAPADLTIRVPRLDEHAVGQLLQLLAMSAAVERQLRPAL